MTVALVKTRTRKQWAKDINLAWFKSVDDVCDVAELCASAAADLGASTFVKLCTDDLQFNRTLANRFRQLGERPDIIGHARQRRLPKGYTTLFEFIPLDQDSLTYAVESGLLTAETSKRKGRATTAALQSNSDQPIGSDLSPDSLPSPKEANEIAKVTGKMVAASDNKIYTGTTPDEQDQYNERRDQFYQTLDAINLLADLKAVDPGFFLDNSEEWWTEKLSTSVIDDSREWLASLLEALERRR